MVEFRHGALVGSLLLNVVLLMSVTDRKEADTPQSPPASPGRSPSATNAARSPAGGQQVRSAWAQVYSADPVEFAATLRFSGCPEAVVRNLVTGDVNRRFQARKDELRRISDFWLDGEEKQTEERRRAHALVELELERQTVLEQCLQIPWYRAPGLNNSFDFYIFFTSFVDPGHARAVGDLFLQVQMESAIQVAERGDFDSEVGQERARELIGRFNDGLRKLIEPKEVEELSIRMFEFDYFDVWKESRRFGGKLTGAELREALRILKPDTIVPFDAPSDLKSAPLTSLQFVEKGSELRKALGDQHFATFLQHHAGDFRHTPGWSDEGKPAPEVFLKLFELQDSVMRELESFDGNSDSQERSQAKIQALQSARDTVTALVPASYLKDYLDAGGRWIREMEDSLAP